MAVYLCASLQMSNFLLAKRPFMFGLASDCTFYMLNLPRLTGIDKIEEVLREIWTVLAVLQGNISVICLAQRNKH